jgi:ABC-type uncharacterized transport system permease subunit
MTTPNPGFLLVLTALAYLIASALYGAATFRGRSGGSAGLMHAGLCAAIIGAVVHTIAIGARCITTHNTPFVSPPDTLSAVGWAITLVFLLLQVCPLRDRTAALGALGMPLAFLSVFAGAAQRAALPTTPIRSRILDDNLVSLHVIAIVFAFGMLTLAVGCALLYVIEDRLLKRKAVAQLLIWRLPPLSVIDNLAFSLVALAFPLLTLGIIAGIITAALSSHIAAQWTVEPHTLASIVTWAIYGGYLWAHTALSWRGSRANTLLIAGLAAALVTYCIPSALHQFG